MAIFGLLQDLANAASIVPLGGAKPDVGVPLSFGLTPAFPAVLDTVQAGDISAIWLNKDVRFADGLGVPADTSLQNYLSDPTRVLGGQLLLDPPLASLPSPGGVLTLPKITNTVTTPPTPRDDLASGIPGFLGQLAGTLPIPVEVPVSVSVTWTVTKGGAPATPGTDFVAPKGLTGQVLELVFLVTDAKELVEGFSPLVKFEIRAKVEVKAFGQSSGEVEVPKPPLPPLTLDIPAILGIPTVAALFRHRDYAIEDGEPGSVLLAVPDNAVLRTANDLAPVLDTLRDTIKRLQSFQSDALSGNFATFLLGLGTLLDALNGQPKFQFVVGDNGRLDLIKFSEHDWRIFPPRLGGSDNAEDKTSAVIVVGVPKQGVKLWGDRDFRQDLEHKFALELFVGAGMWLTIRDFKDVINISDKILFPPPDPPGLGSVANLTRISGFADDLNDKISSIEFKRLT